MIYSAKRDDRRVEGSREKRYSACQLRRGTSVFLYAKTKLCHKYNIDKSETGRESEREREDYTMNKRSLFRSLRLLVELRNPSERVLLFHNAVLNGDCFEGLGGGDWRVPELELTKGMPMKEQGAEGFFD